MTPRMLGDGNDVRGLPIKVSRVQKVGETSAQWAARLRGLAAHCQFKNIEEALLDRFIMGMQSGKEREKLFSKELGELTLAKAIDIAESVRCARAAASATLAPTATAVVPGAESVLKIGETTAGRGNKCSVCGLSSHKTENCRYVNYKCKKCEKKGHLRKMCNLKYVESEEVSEDDDECEIDTGSPITAISQKTYESLFKEVPLSPSNKRFAGYNGIPILSIGFAKLPVVYLGKTIILDVIPQGGPVILGRNFISKFKLELAPILYCSTTESETDDVSDLMARYPELFSDKLGRFKKYKIKLTLKADAKPVFYKARPVAFALKDKVDSEIKRLVRLGILEQIEYSDYASPIVPVLKRDGSVRICADYSQTINKQLLIEKYPLPTIEELFSKLHGGVEFTKLDMSMAYNQFEIDDPDNITCINTNRGLFKYRRLIFGLSSAPAVFQRALNNILADLEGVLCFLDDVLITGRSREEHVARLHQVLQRFRDAGLTLQKEKCSFFQNEITYLGHVINKDGISKSKSKVKAIVEAPVPKNIN
ncbi:uncharacterized protein K02A2.6-like [Cydia pomonella]|uniref:uncharacterized protein K02A2.6-like n=1 Tax=Cydia pomonella TaxID=82600 RepID=UPI002ADDB5FD|nr:uncharacterized protein K02A2.6-like [Cydia pomonella]